MEQKRVAIRFRRPLRFEEQQELIGYFRGLIEAQRSALSNPQGLAAINREISKLGPSQFSMIQSRVQSLLMTTKDENGEWTSEFDKLFKLDFDEKNPLVWTFYFPAIGSLYDQLGIMKKAAVVTNFQNKELVKEVVKQAGLKELVERIDVK